MPARYESIRDEAKAKGASDRAAKTKAAKIENAKRRDEGKPPMRPHRGLGKRA